MKKSSFQRLLIHLDADLARMSHILALKDAFRAHSGEIRIEIASLKANSAKLATLHIKAKLGASATAKSWKNIKSPFTLHKDLQVGMMSQFQNLALHKIALLPPLAPTAAFLLSQVCIRRRRPNLSGSGKGSAKSSIFC